MIIFFLDKSIKVVNLKLYIFTQPDPRLSLGLNPNFSTSLENSGLRDPDSLALEATDLPRTKLAS